MRCLAVCSIALGLQATASAALPPLSGDLSGNLTVPWLADAPPLAWHAQARVVADGALAFEVSANAPGLALQIEALAPAGDAAGTWKLVSGNVDIAQWWNVAAEKIRLKAPSLPTDLECGGALTLSGSGTWHGPDFSGVLNATLTGGFARSAMQNWDASGLALEGEGEFSRERVSLHSAKLTAEALHAAGFAAHNLALEAGAADGERIAVQRAEVSALGGRVALAPFTFDPKAPAVRTTAEFSGIALGEVAALVPQALAEASGQIGGKISVNWNLAAGPQPDAGALDVARDMPATLRLAASPGLLTGHAPPRIAVLPAWAGPLRRWLSFENPAYETLHGIELGQTPLAVENLSVHLFPDGPGGLRTAIVEVAARPTEGASTVERVTFTINVNGPLEQVLRLGTKGRASIHVGTDQ